MLLKMIDGGILAINYESESSSGCESCDYGSSYINEFFINMTTGQIHIKVDQMYEYALSEDYMMKTILQNVDAIQQMTESEFFKWMEEKIPVESKEYEWRDIEVEITFKGNSDE